MLKLSLPLELIAWIASVEARAARQQNIAPAYVFIGLCSIEKLLDPEIQKQWNMSEAVVDEVYKEWNTLAALFRQHELKMADLRREMRNHVGEGVVESQQEGLPRSPECQKVFDRANDLAAGANGSAIGPLHLLAALIEEHEGDTARLLQSQGANLEVFGQEVQELLAAKPEVHAPSTRPATPFLERYGKDLVQMARDGKIHDAIGERSNSAILKIIRTLSREKKNNPVLIGEAGVGKTAIVNGLACRVALGEVPAIMKNRPIIQVAIADLIAGGKYRGEVEERVQGILRETALAGEIILFIDELHTVIGAGSVGESMDIANMLKPALAGGGLRCIGATTTAEYFKYIEKDPAFLRRFEPIHIEEPTPEETLEILQASRERLAQRHGVDIAPEALKAAVKLSVEHLPEQKLPDKAIDVLEEACALVAIPGFSVPLEGKLNKAMVNANDIAQVIAEKTGIPVSQLTESDKARLRALAEELKKRVIGQDEACEKVAAAIVLARTKLKDPNRPIGIFLFLGPTGVGKTQLAKSTARALFGSEKAMVRLDMSEYMEKHTVSRLIGAPPGYVGHDDEGQLTGALRRRPYIVVLLDEIEKAHGDVLNLFLQVFDDGRLTDSKGHTINVTNALFVLTSNLRARTAGLPTSGQDDLRSNLVNHGLRSELVNRLDEIIAFSILGEDSMKKIAQLLIAEIAERLKPQMIEIEVSDEALSYLSKEGYTPQFGARPLRRLIQQEIATPLGGMLLSGVVQEGNKVIVTIENNRVSVRRLAGLPDGSGEKLPEMNHEESRD